MRRLYSFLIAVLSPYLLFRLWWKGRKLAAYRERIAERFCWDKGASQVFDVWLHAVSLGEVIAATPLIETLLNDKYSVLITTMTPTGAAQVQKAFGARVSHRYIPYDLASALRRFFARIKPRVGVIMETELWPNLIAEAKAADIPLLLANARLSERSFKGYSRFRFIFAPILRQFSAILAQSVDDAERFRRLGAEVSRVEALGNMKFDLPTNRVELSQVHALKALWGSERIVLIIASTHEDEEARILQHLRPLQAAIPGLILLIAPRHPERFEEVYQLCLQQGFKTGLRSQLQTIHPDNELVVLDCLGELLALYQISDYAFVGGSLVPHGGHNVLEPIAMQVPVFSGDQVHNFKAICRELVEAQALVLVKDANELIAALIQLHGQPEQKQAMVARASLVLESNKGAVLKYRARIAAAMREQVSQ